MVLVPMGAVNCNLVLFSTMNSSTFVYSNDTVLTVYRKIDSLVPRINE